MGFLIYNSGAPFPVDDRLLAHLQVVIVDKLRRQESFSFSWSDDGHHSTVWVHPMVPLQFVFEGNRAPALNRVWLEQLSETANSVGGLQALPEPAPPKVVVTADVKG